MRISDWSSDVCSSDLLAVRRQRVPVDVEREVGDLHRLAAIERDRIQLRATGLSAEEVHRLAVGRKRRRVDIPDFRRQPLRRQRSEEHTSELQSQMRISYAVFCLTNKKTHYQQSQPQTTSIT